MDYNLDKLVERRGTNSIKWEFINEGKNNALLPLWIADMDFSCAPPILDAIHARVNKTVLGYSVPLDDYYSSVQQWFAKRFNWTIKREEIVRSPGIVPALSILIKAFTEEGDGIILQTPSYQPFTFLIANNKRTLLNNALINEDGKYRIDFSDLEQKAKQPNTKMMMLCSPHNPVGRVWTKEELNRIVDICLQNDVLIVSDEIHCDLLRQGVVHTPIATLTDDKRIVTCTAPSKSFNIAGLQMASIIIRDEEMRAIWTKEFIGKAGLLGSNPLSICATTAAYNEGESWLNTVNEYIESNFMFVEQYLKTHLPRALFTIPEGTFFAWIDFSGYIQDPEQLELVMINEAGVALSEGYTFGKEGIGFERINVACPRALLEQGLDRIKQALLSFEIDNEENKDAS